MAKFENFPPPLMGFILRKEVNEYRFIFVRCYFAKRHADNREASASGSLASNRLNIDI